MFCPAVACTTQVCNAHSKGIQKYLCTAFDCHQMADWRHVRYSRWQRCAQNSLVLLKVPLLNMCANLRCALSVAPIAPPCPMQLPLCCQPSGHAVLYDSTEDLTATVALPAAKIAAPAPGVVLLVKLHPVMETACRHSRKHREQLSPFVRGTCYMMRLQTAKQLLC